MYLNNFNLKQCLATWRFKPNSENFNFMKILVNKKKKNYIEMVKVLWYI